MLFLLKYSIIGVGFELGVEDDADEGIELVIGLPFVFFISVQSVLSVFKNIRIIRVIRGLFHVPFFAKTVLYNV